MKKIFKSFLVGFIMSLFLILISACDNINLHTHSFTIDKSDEIKHWKECSCGEKSEEENHTFGEWVTTKEPTETEDGIKEKECSGCHYKETEKISVVTEKTTVDADIWNNAFKNIDKVENCKIVLEAPEIGSLNTILKYNDYYAIQMKSNVGASDYLYYTKNSNLENNYIGLQQDFTKFDGNYYDKDNKKGYETLEELIEKEGRKWTLRYGGDFEKALLNFKFIDKFDEFSYDDQTKSYFYQGEIEAEFNNPDSGEQKSIKLQVSNPIVKFKENHIEYLKLNATLGGEKATYEYESGKIVIQQDLIDSYWDALFTFELNEDKKTYSLGKANLTDFNIDLPVILHLPIMYKGLPVTHVNQETFSQFDEAIHFFIPRITLVIPSNIKCIEDNAIYDCFEKVYYDGSIDDWCKIEFARQSSNPMFCKQFYMRNSNDEWEEPKNIVIPNDITTIGAYAFAGCRVTSVVIPNSVTKIGFCAFLGCESLKDVYYNGSLTEWSSISVDSYNVYLTNATIHYNFGSDHEASHTHTYFIKSDTKNHWQECSCGAKKEIENHKYSDWIMTKEPTLTEEGTKEKECSVCHHKETETLPIIESLKYQLNEDGKSYSVAGIGTIKDSNLIIPEEYNGLPVTSIGNHAFADCSNLISITIPTSITSIGDYAFFTCYRLVEIYNLSSINITLGSSDNGCIGYYAKEIHTSLEEESNLITKDDYVFYKDNSNKYYLVGYNGTATDLVLPNDIEGNTYEINRYAFFNCNNLTSVFIPDSATSIGEFAFYGCSLSRVTISNNVTSIGEYAFSYCSSLKNIEIPVGVTSIENGVFSGCGNLTSIAIPKSVTNIGSAFSSCSSLNEVYFMGTSTEWNNITIDSSNSNLNSATIYYYSETQPTEAGNYWHYVDGAVIKW